MPKSKHLTLTI